MPLSSTTVSQSLSGALHVYISKYCEVVTGGRVVFQGYHTFTMQNGGWYRFKCQTCHDNWNMKSDLFSNATSSPKELTDWLMMHQHICETYRPGIRPACSLCGWSWEKHKAAQPVYDIETGQWHAPSPPPPSPSRVAVPLPVLPISQISTWRECVICGKEISRVSGVGICQVCYKLAKQVHDGPQNRKTTEGRMFRREKEPCELSTDTNEKTSSD